MRQAGDGPSGFLPLVILPVLWLALYGTRRQLLITLAVAALVLLVPWLLIGGVRYPNSTPRSALLVLAVAALAGLTIQRLVGEMRAARDFSAAILDTAGSLVVVTDAQARIERFNRTAERVSGFTADAMVGRSLIDALMPPESVAAIRAELAAARPAGLPAPLRARARHRRRRPPARGLDGDLPARRQRRDRAPDRDRHRHHRAAAGRRGAADLHRPARGHPRARHDADRGQGPRRPLPARQPRLAALRRLRRDGPDGRGAVRAGDRRARAARGRGGVGERRGDRVRARDRRHDRAGGQVPAARRRR